MRQAIAVFTRRRTWGEFAYALLGLPQGVAFFVVAVTTLAVSGGLFVTFVGLPLLAATNLLCRLLGSESRRAGNILLGESLPGAPKLQRRPGLLGWIGSCLTDRWSWQARLYLVLKLPLGILTFTAAVAMYLYGLGGVTYAIWRPFLPCNSTPDGRCHRGVQWGSNYTMDTPFRVALTAVAGLLLLLAAPWVVKGVVRLDRLVVRGLLVPNRSAERVEELEQSRAIAVEDAATTLRRIERDLHDGAQARLVALAMNVGLAKEKLAEGGDPAEAQRLLDSAHAGAKDAIAELRDLAKGIHPPVLDAGLDTALATLAANSAVPSPAHDRHHRPAVARRRDDRVLLRRGVVDQRRQAQRRRHRRSRRPYRRRRAAADGLRRGLRRRPRRRRDRADRARRTGADGRRHTAGHEPDRRPDDGHSGTATAWPAS